MKTIENGNVVKLHYKGTFPNGEVFDDSRVRGIPMDVLVGNGNLIPAFETALVGMTEGQTKTISLSAAEAYGARHDEAVVSVPVTAFPENFEFLEGTPVTGKSPDGRNFNATIISFNDKEVVLDHNHPLAGKDINFDIEIIKIDTEKNNVSLSDYTVKELRSLAKERKIKGFSTMKKAELVESLSS